MRDGTHRGARPRPGDRRRRTCHACSTASTAPRRARAARVGAGARDRQADAEAHGGAVHADNDPGGGARLTLELPDAGDEPKPSSRAACAPSRPEPFTKLLASSKAILRLAPVCVRMPSKRHSDLAPPSPPLHRPPGHPDAACAATASRSSPSPLPMLATRRLRRLLAVLRRLEHPGRKNSRLKSSSPTSPGACANTASNAETASGPGGEGHGLQDQRASGGPAKMEAAQKACKKLPARTAEAQPLPAGKGGTRGSRRKVRQVHARTRHRSDASSSEGRVSIRIHGSPSGGASARPQPRKPRLPESAELCQKLLPFKGPKGAPVGGPPTQAAGPVTPAASSIPRDKQPFATGG